MLLFVADEDFDGRIVRGLFHRKPDLKLVRGQDVGLLGASDEKLLEWASDNARVVLTHDRRTMPKHVADRLEAGLHIPGVFIVTHLASLWRCLGDLQMIPECSEHNEWQDQINFLPFWVPPEIQ